MKNFFRAQFKDKGTAKINGASYYGETITITSSSKVTVDGQTVSDTLIPPIHVEITGDVHLLDGLAASVSVTGSAHTISTMSGDVNCGDVSGNVETMSGDVTCKKVGGSLGTMSGNVRLLSD